LPNTWVGRGKVKACLRGWKEGDLIKVEEIGYRRREKARVEGV